MKKVSLNFIVDNLTEIGWDYTCGRMSRGMEIYDGIMRHWWYPRKKQSIGMKMSMLTLTENCDQ